VSGNIQALYADFNTKVKKGQLVALIDPQLYQAKVDQARANVDSARASVLNARATLEKSNADIASAEANVANLRANVTRAKSAVKDAQVKFQRRQDLTRQGILATEDLDTAQATYDQAVAQQEAAQAQLDAGVKQVQAATAQRDVADAQLGSAQAQVKQNDASLQQAQVDLEHTRIIAPVDGTVIARQMDVGQTVAASFQAPTIFQVAQDLTKMQVDTNVDEADIGKVEVGQAAMFTVDAHPGQTFRGNVTQIRQAPINVQNVITYDVVVGVNNEDLKLLPGMTANVKVLVDRADNALRIPNAALRFKPTEASATPNDSVQAAGSAPSRPGSGQGGWKGRQPQAQPVIWVLGADGKARPVQVKTGISDGNMTVVESGDLHEGDRVITGETGNTSGRSASKGGPGAGNGPRMRF
jgi:HlyD family secretion protein